MSRSSIARAIAILSLSTNLHAATMFVDFGRTDNQTEGNWNNVHGPSGTTTLTTPSIDLIDDGGNDTDYTLVTDFGDGGSWAGDGADYATGTKPGPFAGAPTTATGDSLFARTPANTTITLTGLSASETYDLVFYGARGNNGGASTFLVTDNSGAKPLQSFNVYQNNSNVASFSGLVPDGDGEISIVFQGILSATGTGTNENQQSNGALNALQITSNIPEPSIALLGMLGGLTLLRRRR